MDNLETYTAFVGNRRLAGGSLEVVLRSAKDQADAGGDGLLIFHDESGKQVDFNLRGSMKEVLDRALGKPVRVGPGRPKLGVVSREVSLLPRHWEWLEGQANGTSAALRRLVDQARKSECGETEKRRRIEAAGRVMTVMAGDLPGFEEAFRSLYARDWSRMERKMARWPRDVRTYLLERTKLVFGPDEPD